MKPESSEDSISQLERTVRDLNYLHRVSQKVSEVKEIDKLLNEIMESCKEVTNAEASSLLIYDEKENILYFEVALGEKGGEVKKITCNIGEGIAGWVAENREALLVPDCYADKRFNPDYDRQTGFKTRNMLCVPMIKDDRLIGVIQVINKKDGTQFTQSDLNLFQILATQCGISIENARLMEMQIRQKALERELETARAIQNNLLPEKLPEVSGADVAFGLKSAKEVGGDYYNIYRIDDENFLFFICDVSGKSISAALIVSTVCSCFLTLLRDNTAMPGPAEIVRTLNRVLVESTTDEKFATAWFGLYNTSSRRLTSINAGHNSTFLFRDGILHSELKKGGMFLGIFDGQYESEEVALEAGDSLVCFTDGISEALSLTGDFYGEERLIKVFERLKDSDAEESLSCIFSDVADFTSGAEQSDDITCGVIKIVRNY